MDNSNDDPNFIDRLLMSGHVKDLWGRNHLSFDLKEFDQTLLLRTLTELGAALSGLRSI